MKSWVRANKGFLTFLLLLGVFRTAVADYNPIPSPSMRPNLLEGDVVFVNRLAYNVKVPLTDVVLAHTGEPARGDVVTFTSPADGVRLIKRIVAIPGDVVELRDEQLIINGVSANYVPVETVSEPLGDGTHSPGQRLREQLAGQDHIVQIMPAIAARRSFAPVTIPPDQYLMLGDNRDRSGDSRYIGLVPRKLLIGQAIGIMVSADIQGNWMPRTERFAMRMP